MNSKIGFAMGLCCFLLLGTIAFMADYFINKSTLSAKFQVGFWFGFIFMCIATLIGFTYMMMYGDSSSGDYGGEYAQ